MAEAKAEEKVEEAKPEAKTATKAAKGGKALTTDDIIEAIKSMTVIELSDLVKSIEDTFGVSPAPVMMAGAPAAGAGQAGAAAPAEEEEKVHFDVVLQAAGDKKIQVIKVVRTLTGLGIKEAKALVDEAPKPVKEGIPKDEAEKVKADLEEAGATVEIK